MIEVTEHSIKDVRSYKFTSSKQKEELPIQCSEQEEQECVIHKLVNSSINGISSCPTYNVKNLVRPYTFNVSTCSSSITVNIINNPRCKKYANQLLK